MMNKTPHTLPRLICHDSSHLSPIRIWHTSYSICYWFPEEFNAYFFFLHKNCIEQYFSVHCAVNEETWVDCWGAKDQWQGTSYFAKYEPSFEPFRSWCISPQTPHGVKDFTNVIATLDPEAPRRCFLLKEFLLNWKYFPSIVVLVLVHQLFVNQSLSFQNGDCLPLWLSDQAWGILRSNRLCSALRSVRT